MAGTSTTSDIEPGAEGAGRDVLGNEMGDGHRAADGTVTTGDADDADAPRIPRREDEDDPGERRPPPGLKYEDDPRDALAKSFSQARKVQGRDLTPDYEEEAAADEAENVAVDGDEAEEGEVRFVSGPGTREGVSPREVDAKPAPRKIADLGDEDLVTVKVDGQDIEMRYGDLKARAQMNMAADARLEEAKRILAEAKDTIRNPAPAATDRQHQPARRPGEQSPGGTPPATQQQPTKTKVDATKLRSAVDIIQTGTPEEGAEALASVIAEASGNTDPSAVQHVVQSAIEADRVEQAAKREVNAALTGVSEKFSDVINDPEIGEIAFNRTVGALVANLRKIGVPEEDIRQTSSDRLFGEYARLRQDPEWRDKLPAMETVTTDVAKAMRKRFSGDENTPIRGKPAPKGADASGESRSRVVVQSDRSARTTGMSTQPRSASMRADFSQRAAPRKDTSKTIAAMREARG